MGRGTGSRRGKGRLGVAAVALAALAGAVILLTRPEGRGPRAARGTGALEPALALRAPSDLAPGVQQDGVSEAASLLAPSGSRAVSKLARREPARAAPPQRPSLLKIGVSCGGRPAADIGIALETRAGGTRAERALGRADAQGTLAASVAPASSAWIVLRSDLRGAELARSAELELLPASTYEVALEVAARRLVLVVPELAFDHRFSTQYRMIPLHDPSGDAVRAFFEPGAWRSEPGGSRTDLGWVEPGRYAFRVQIEAHVLEVTAEVEAGQGDARFALRETGG